MNELAVERVLLVTRNLPPLLGGMERLNWHMAAELAKTHEVRIIGPQGCAAVAPPGIEVHEIPLRPLWKFLLAAFSRARKLATQWQPDIILAGSGLTAPIAYHAARACGAKTAVYVHGLDIVATHPVYRWLWLPFMRLFDQAFANSTNTADLARRAGVACGRITTIHPGTVIPQTQDALDMAFRMRLDPDAGPILLSVGRLTERKGLAEFVLHALPAIIEAYPGARLVIIGDDAPNALRKGAGDLVENLRAAVASSGMQNHILRIGACNDTELAQAYACAAVHVFPVRQVPGDIEGFGMVAIEAAAHGLPTVAFAVGGIPDAIADGVSGYLVQPGDYATFAAAVNRVLADGGQSLKTSSRKFAAGFAWKRFGERLRAALSTIGEQRDDPRQKGHAVLDLESRAAKARKIEILLDLAPAGRLRLLEVGTGSGGIAHYFGTHPKLDCDVDAVDVQDTRQIFDGYRFTRVDGTDLPFPDAHFDVVISNHVIEHVGDAASQLKHLREINRVLKLSGVGYLAVPNRWMLTEPHYRLKFLSWWPHRWRTPYLRLWRKGEFYDCEPLEMRQMERMLATSGLTGCNLCVEGWRATFDIERPGWWGTRLLARVPDALLRVLNPVNPTLIYRVGRRE